MAQLVYFSLTLQTHRFIQKLDGVDSYRIQGQEPAQEMDQDYILVVPTYDPIITQPVNHFLETGANLSKCQGTFGGGNRNFASAFGFTVDDLEKKYGIPVLHKFEFQGSPCDVEQLEKELAQIATRCDENLA